MSVTNAYNFVQICSSFSVNLIRRIYIGKAFFIRVDFSKNLVIISTVPANSKRSCSSIGRCRSR